MALRDLRKGRECRHRAAVDLGYSIWPTSFLSRSHRVGHVSVRVCNSRRGAVDPKLLSNPHPLTDITILSNTRNGKGPARWSWLGKVVVVPGRGNTDLQISGSVLLPRDDQDQQRCTWLVQYRQGMMLPTRVMPEKRHDLADLSSFST